jgi:GNAT superfamily N-acetyltransferase
VADQAVDDVQLDRDAVAPLGDERGRVELGVGQGAHEARGGTALGPQAAPWWIAGGWALDLFLGYESRPHADTDVLVLRRDQSAVHQALSGWDLHAADPPGALRPWESGEELPVCVHDVWCRASAGAPWALQVMLAEAVGDAWVYRRDRRVRVPLAALGRVSPDGLPYLAPEVQLLHKARPISRPKDVADFAAVAPRLPADRRAWLRDALVLCAPAHPWLAWLDRWQPPARTAQPAHARGVLAAVRRAHPGEADELRGIAIAAKGYWAYPDDFMAAWTRRFELSPEYVRDNEVAVAVVDGRTVGFAALIARAGECELDHLWVLPEHIGSGLGRDLFGWARSRARELGAARLRWDAEPGAVGFYERMGGRVVGRTWTRSERWVPAMCLELGAGDGMGPANPSTRASAYWNWSPTSTREGSI